MAAKKNTQSYPQVSETLGDKWQVNRVSNLLSHQCMDESRPRALQIFQPRLGIVYSHLRIPIIQLLLQ